MHVVYGFLLTSSSQNKQTNEQIEAEGNEMTSNACWRFVTSWDFHFLMIWESIIVWGQS